MITVHDRALFDYLTRKLSPAFHSDILVNHAGIRKSEKVDEVSAAS